MCHVPFPCLRVTRTKQDTGASHKTQEHQTLKASHKTQEHHTLNLIALLVCVTRTKQEMGSRFRV